jgi:transposase
MKRFVETEDRRQGVLLPEYLGDWVAEENPARVIDVFVDELDLGVLGFEGVVPEATERPAYHPGLLLKIYIYGYINQIASSRRLEREAQRNVEMMWLTGRLAPDFKTIADFRKDNGPAIRASCRRFVELCRRLEPFTQAVAAIDGSKFKAVNTRAGGGMCLLHHQQDHRRRSRVSACALSNAWRRVHCRAAGFHPR